MQNRWMVSSTVVTFALLLAAATAPGQTGYKAPRAPDGKPDLNGIWQVFNAAHWDIEPHAHRRPGCHDGRCRRDAAGLGVVDGGIPYSRRRWRSERRTHASGHADPLIKCYMPGVPRATTCRPFQIIQTPQYVMIAYEFAGARRTIYMEEPTEAPADFWMGDSRGQVGRGHPGGRHQQLQRPDLVRQCRQLPQRRAARRRAVYAREPDPLIYEVTIEDPKVFTRPWKMSMPVYRRVETTPSSWNSGASSSSRTSCTGTCERSDK